jgi:hypothetical protein
LVLRSKVATTQRIFRALAHRVSSRNSKTKEPGQNAMWLEQYNAWNEDQDATFKQAKERPPGYDVETWTAARTAVEQAGMA